MLPVDRAAECGLIKFPVSVECGVAGRKLGETRQISRLRNIQLVEVADTKDAFGGGLDPIYIVSVRTVAERNLVEIGC
ncbi:hypothetical protein D3C87_2125950 [compost metagenome]